MIAAFKELDAMPVSSKHVPYDLGLRWSQRLHKAFKQLSPSPGQAPSLMTCQAALARMLGHAHWHAYAATRQAPAEVEAPSLLSPGSRPTPLDDGDSTFPAASGRAAAYPARMPVSLRAALTTLAWRDGTVMYVERRGEEWQVQVREHGEVRNEAHPVATVQAWLVWASLCPAYQEQRLDLVLDGRPVGLSMGRLPTINGEIVVLRLRVAAQATPPGLRTLGFPNGLTRYLEVHGAQTGRLIVLSGPVGSGASTTLRSLKHLVQQRHEGRAQVHDLSALSEPAAVADALQTLGPRADGGPQIVMLALDRLTPEGNQRLMNRIASDPDLLVLGRLHAVSAVGALPRLVDLGWSPEGLAAVLPRLMVLHQRLVPTLCPHCSRPTGAALDADPTTATWVERLQRLHASAGHPASGWDDRVRWRGAGCTVCRGQAINGQRALVESFIPDQVYGALTDEGLADLVRRGEWAVLQHRWDAPPHNPLNAPGNAGARLWHHGLRLVAQGLVAPQDLESTLPPHVA